MSKPSLSTRELKDASGYIVIVAWPDGLEEQVSDFATKADAVAWIERDFEAWLTKHPKKMMALPNPN